MYFDHAVQSRRILIPNRVDIFGNQFICDSEDNIVGTEEHLLSNATTISLEEAPALVEKFGGICYPAHIDRSSNGIIAVLGSFPKSPKFHCAEVHNNVLLDEMSSSSRMPKEKLIVSSDAHYLWNIKEKNEFFILEDIPENADNAGEYLLKFLKGSL